MQVPQEVSDERGYEDELDVPWAVIGEDGEVHEPICITQDDSTGRQTVDHYLPPGWRQHAVVVPRDPRKRGIRYSSTE